MSVMPIVSYIDTRPKNAFFLSQSMPLSIQPIRHLAIARKGANTMYAEIELKTDGLKSVIVQIENRNNPMVAISRNLR
jgi:hypothetical protein